jgi:hypothetical protein
MVLTGCTSEAGQIKQLDSPVPQERLQAVRWLADNGSRGSLASLVDALDDRDAAVRWAAAEALRDRTGETFGYRAGDPEARRREAISRWRRWLQGEGIPLQGESRQGDAKARPRHG